MEEKKITDEEIAKAILQSIEYSKTITYFDEWGNCKAIMMADVIDLIHRLHSENKQLKDEKEEIMLFNLAIQNGEIDMRIESEMAKSFYNSIIQIFEQNGAKNFFTTTIDIEGKKSRYAFTIEKVCGQTVAEKLAEQKAEIERLTEKLDITNEQLYHSCMDKGELQKQVDELKKRCEIAEGTKSRLTIFDRIEIHDKAVKDTAKEILAMFDDRNYITEKELKQAIAERYSVEVEL